MTYAGRYGGEILSLEVGSRACGMGGAYVAVANDGFCSWWNPSGVVKNKGPWVVGMYASPFGLSNFGFIGVGGYLMKRVGGAFSVASLTIDEIPELPVELVKRPIGFFSDKEFIVLLSGAYELRRDMEVGINIKHINYNLFNTRAMGWGIDVGWSYELYDISVGAVLKDIGGTRIKWNTNRKDSRETNLVIGTAYTGENLVIAVDVGYEYKVFYKIGAEYSIMDLLFLRVGVSDNIKGGIGVRVRNIGIDYAVFTHKLGLTHQISVSFTY
jgi:hypothetical protein